MRQKPNMIYTPNRHIPIGEAIKNPDGTLAIRVKRNISNQYDDISLDTLYQSAVKQAIPSTNAETRILQGLAE